MSNIITNTNAPKSVNTIKILPIKDDPELTIKELLADTGAINGLTTLTFIREADILEEFVLTHSRQHQLVANVDTYNIQPTDVVVKTVRYMVHRCFIRFLATEDELLKPFYKLVGGTNVIADAGLIGREWLSINTSGAARPMDFKRNCETPVGHYRDQLGGYPASDAGQVFEIRTAEIDR